MQIFRVSPNPKVSAEFLDNRRLSKQVLELYQIIRVCLGELDIIQTGNGYRHHPVVEHVYHNGQPYIYGALVLLDAFNNEHLRRRGHQSAEFREKLEKLHQTIQQADKVHHFTRDALPPMYIEGKERVAGDASYALYQKLLYKKWSQDTIPPRCDINLKDPI